MIEATTTCLGASQNGSLPACSSIISDADDYVQEVVAALQAAGVRAEADTRNEKINYKVREHSVGKVPVILALGGREVDERTVTLRRLGEKETRVLPLDQAAEAHRLMESSAHIGKIILETGLG